MSAGGVCRADPGLLDRHDWPGLRAGLVKIPQTRNTDSLD